MGYNLIGIVRDLFVFSRPLESLVELLLAVQVIS